MGITNLSGLEVAGVPTMGISGLPTTFGNYWFVDGEHGSDGGTGAMDAPFQTVARAYDAAVTNNDDVIAIRGCATTYTLTAMLDVTKSRVHFVGLDGAWRLYGQGVKINLTALTGATNIATMRNTGVRNTFTNIKWTNGSTVTEGIYCVAEGGEYAQYTDCEFYKSTDLDQTGAAELLLNGDSAQFTRCTIGSLADAVAGTSIIHPCVQLTKNLVTASSVTRDSIFEDCLFWRQSKNTTNVFINAANASDVERMLLLKRCGFINSLASAALPAVCIRAAATLTTGNIILDPGCFASNVTKIATATGIIVTGAAVNSGSGIGVNAA